MSTARGAPPVARVPAAVDRSPRAPDRAPHRWVAVGALGLGSFSIGTDMFVVAGLLGGLAGDLAVPVGDAGAIVTVFALAYATGAPVLGTLLGGRRLRPVLIGSLVVFAASNVASALAPSLTVLLVSRGSAALAAAAYVPAAGAAAVAAVPATHRGRALAVVLGGASVATAVGAPLGVLLAGQQSWRAAFLMVAVLAGGAALAVLRLGTGDAPLARTRLRERLRPLRSPMIIGTLAVTMLLTTGSHAMYTYLDELWGAATEPAGAGLLIAAFGAGGLLGTWCGGSAADRWGSRTVVLVAAAGLVAVAATVPLVTGPAAVGLVVGWGIAAWGVVPAQQLRVVGLDAGPAPVVLALNSSAIHLGFATGALLGGVVVDTAGADRLWRLAVACCGAALILHTILRRRARP